MLPETQGRPQRIAELKQALQQRILVLDGAMGTLLKAQNLEAADFGGPELEGCNENLSLTRPDLIQRIHAEYFAAGADVTETNTFGGTPLVLGEYGLADKAREINARAAQLARRAAEQSSKDLGRPCWVAGSIGPTTKAISVTGGVTFADLVSHFEAQANGLLEGGADYLLVETSQETRKVKAGILGI